MASNGVTCEKERFSVEHNTNDNACCIPSLGFTIDRPFLGRRVPTRNDRQLCRVNGPESQRRPRWHINICEIRIHALERIVDWIGS